MVLDNDFTRELVSIQSEEGSSHKKRLSISATPSCNDILCAVVVGAGHTCG